MKILTARPAWLRIAERLEDIPSQQFPFICCEIDRAASDREIPRSLAHAMKRRVMRNLPNPDSCVAYRLWGHPDNPQHVYTQEEARQARVLACLMFAAQSR